MLSLSSQSSQSSQSPPSQSPNAGGAGRVHLELESDFEDAGTVRRFLVLVTEQRFDGPGFPSRSGFFSSWRPALHALLRLLDKWGCERGVAALRALGGALVVRGELVWSDALVFGAMLNDLAMCRDVVARFARNTVHHPRCGALPTSTAGADAGAAAADDDDDDDKTRIRILYGDECAPMFLLGAAPFELSCALPQAYQFALVHASLHHDLGSDDPEDADDFADTFVAAATYALQLQRRGTSPRDARGGHARADTMQSPRSTRRFPRSRTL